MLPDGHCSQPEFLSKLCGVDWTLGFQEFCDGSTGLSLRRGFCFLAHVNISKDFSLQSQ